MGAEAIISREFLHAAFSEPVDKVSPLSVNIDKYRVRGTGRIVGTITIEPLPDDRRIRLQMTMSGEAIGCDRTLVRSLQVHTLDRSAVRVRQEFTVSPQGIEAEPAEIHASTRSQLQFIETDRPPPCGLLVRGLARAKFRRTPDENDRLATRVAEIALTEQAGRESTEMLAAGNVRLRGQLLDPLRLVGIQANQIKLASSAAGVSASIDFPLPTRKDPPPFSEGIDVGLRLHQGPLNHIAQQSLAGFTIEGSALERTLDRLYRLLNVPPPRVTDKRPWSIVLAKKDPMVVRFERNALELTIHGAAYSVGDEKYPAMDIVLRLAIQKTATGWRTLRQFPSVTAPTTATPNKEDERRRLALVVFLAKKFNEIIPIEIDVSHLFLPPPLPPNSPGSFTRALARDGWLLLEWQRSR